MEGTHKIKHVAWVGKTEWAHALAGGLSVCGAEGSVAQSDTVPEAVIIGKKELNLQEI